MAKCLYNECIRDAVSRGYCDKHYRRLLKRGSAEDHGSRVVDEGDEKDRFHKKYEIKESGCWIWTGGARSNARGVLYPRHWLDNKTSCGAHRFSYRLKNGEIPKGMYVCHNCDTPMCVNPDHLFIGTHQDNMNDMVVKRRSFFGRGEDKKGRAKLTNKQAKEIREMKMSQSKIGKLFNISQTTVGRIKRGESY
jgi:hypothetical protein